MSAKLWETGTTNAFNTTLNGSISSTDTTITLTTVTGLVAPGVLTIDRVNASGTATPTVREYVSFTGISGSQVTGVTRGVAGSTNQSHSSGAQVEECFSVTHWGEMVDFLQVSHDSVGGIVASNATLTTPILINPRVIDSLNASGASVTISDLRIIRYVNASGASVVGMTPSGASGSVLTSSGNSAAPVFAPSSSSGTGGFNALFQTPGGLASQANVGGLVPVPVAFTAGFVQAFVQTPASVASVGYRIMKNLNTVFAVGGILATATFGSSASISNTALVAGDVLTLDIVSTASSAADLSILLRAT